MELLFYSSRMNPALTGLNQPQDCFGVALGVSKPSGAKGFTKPLLFFKLRERGKEGKREGGKETAVSWQEGHLSL